MLRGPRVLAPEETELVGRWVMVDGQVVGDETSRRIEWLVATTLREVARDGTGWFTLFVDPSDSRLWERFYPHSEMHGGGPAMLQAISPERATSRYGRLPA